MFSWSFYVTLAFMVLLLPLQWILAATIAAAVHELFHILCLRMFSVSNRKIRVHLCGAVIPVEDIGRGEELICALAGPLGGFLLVLLFPAFPRISICAIVQSLYNLLPIYPLDGGRALDCFCALVLPPTYAAWVCRFIMWLFLGATAALAFYLSLIMNLGALPILLCAAIFAKAIYACNHRPMALQ